MTQLLCLKAIYLDDRYVACRCNWVNKKVKSRLEAVVKIQTQGPLPWTGCPIQTTAQKSYLEPSSPPPPPQAAPNLKVPCKKLNFPLAAPTHLASDSFTLLIPSEIFTSSPALEPSRSPPRQHQKLRGEPSAKCVVQPRWACCPPAPSPAHHPPSRGNRRPDAKKTKSQGGHVARSLRRCKCRAHWAQPRLRCCPGNLRLTCSFC